MRPTDHPEPTEATARRRRCLAAATLSVAALAGVLATPAAAAPVAPPTCSTVAHVGDSTTVMMGGALRAAYSMNGWRTPTVDAGGGRAIGQALPGDRTGLAAVVAIKATGFTGCWVIALGTNDTANADAWGGSVQARAARRRAAIEAMMTAIGNRPVMWVNVHLTGTGFYTPAAAAAWNAVLVAERVKFPNMTILDWDAIAAVHPEWVGRDGIHDTTAGSRVRASLIAAAAAMVWHRPKPLASASTTGH